MSDLLFDSDVLIDILRNQQKTLIQVQALSEKYESLYCSAITVGEIFAGMLPKEEISTRQLLDSLNILPVTAEIAAIAGRLKYRSKSHTLFLDDCLIAATALTHNISLATKNVKHYPFRELKLEKVL